MMTTSNGTERRGEHKNFDDPFQIDITRYLETNRRAADPCYRWPAKPKD